MKTSGRLSKRNATQGMYEHEVISAQNILYLCIVYTDTFIATIFGGTPLFFIWPKCELGGKSYLNVDLIAVKENKIKRVLKQKYAVFVYKIV